MLLFSCGLLQKAVRSAALSLISTAPTERVTEGAVLSFCRFRSQLPSQLAQQVKPRVFTESSASVLQPQPAEASGPVAVVPGPGPLTVQYPFQLPTPLQSREAVVFSLQTLSPARIISLHGEVFNVPVRVDILQRVVRYLRAKWQQGTHSSKRRHEVSGGGRKPRPQKGTGHSRQGSIRSPLWVGGGAAHGPKPRSHAHKLPKAVQLLGMKCALSARTHEGRLFLLDTVFDASLKDYCALRDRLEQLTTHALGGTWLLVDCGDDDLVQRARLRKQLKCSTRMEVLDVADLTVYHILKYQRLVMSHAAAQALTTALAAPRRAVRRPVLHTWYQTQHAAILEAEAELKAAVAPKDCVISPLPLEGGLSL